jgi:hypothetical protein
MLYLKVDANHEEIGPDADPDLANTADMDPIPTPTQRSRS